MRILGAILLPSALLLAACTSNSSGGGSCTVVDNGNGTSTVRCPDGTSSTVGEPRDAGNNALDAAHGDAATMPADASFTDASPGDAAPRTDAGTPPDAAILDAATRLDAGATADASAPRDAGARPDASAGADAGAPGDAGSTRDAGEATDGGAIPADILPSDCSAFPPGQRATGNFVVTNTVQMMMLSPYACIHGMLDLSVDPTVTGLVALENLRVVTGEIRIVGPTLSDIHVLSGLRHVGRLSAFNSPALTSLSFPSMVSMREFAAANVAVTTVSFPALQVLRAADMFPDAMTTLDMPALREVGIVRIGGGTQLQHLSLPSLERTHRYLPPGGFTPTESLTIAFNSRLESISLPRFQRGSLSLLDLNALTTVDIPPRLEGFTYVRNTPQLPSCEARSLCVSPTQCDVGNVRESCTAQNMCPTNRFCVEDCSQPTYFRCDY